MGVSGQLDVCALGRTVGRSSVFPQYSVFTAGTSPTTLPRAEAVFEVLSAFSWVMCSLCGRRKENDPAFPGPCAICLFYL